MKNFGALDIHSSDVASTVFVEGTNFADNIGHARGAALNLLVDYSTDQCSLYIYQTLFDNNQYNNQSSVDEVLPIMHFGAGSIVIGYIKPEYVWAAGYYHWYTASSYHISIVIDKCNFIDNVHIGGYDHVSQNQYVLFSGGMAIQQTQTVVFFTANSSTTQPHKEVP